MTRPTNTSSTLIILSIIAIYSPGGSAEEPTIYIQKHINSRFIISGSKHFVSCITPLSDSHNTNISWINQNGQTITNLVVNDRIRIENNILLNLTKSLHSTDLIFDPIQVEDSGNYTCSLKTKTSTINKTLPLTILPNLYKPKTQLNIVSKLNSNLTIPCFSPEIPKPNHMIWWKNNFRLKSNSKYLININKWKLTIINTTREDQGTYQCQMLYKKTKDTLIRKIPYSVNIMYGPEWKSSSFKSEIILTPPRPNISLSCDSYGYPPPSITWTKNYKKIHSPLHHSNQNSTESTLKLNFNSRTVGTYTCTSSNTLGTISRSFFVKNNITSPPSPNIKILKIGASYILFKYLPPQKNPHPYTYTDHHRKLY